MSQVFCVPLRTILQPCQTIICTDSTPTTLSWVQQRYIMLLTLTWITTDAHKAIQKHYERHVVSTKPVSQRKLDYERARPRWLREMMAEAYVAVPPLVKQSLLTLTGLQHWCLFLRLSWYRCNSLLHAQQRRCCVRKSASNWPRVWIRHCLCYHHLCFYIRRVGFPDEAPSTLSDMFAATLILP